MSTYYYSSWSKLNLNNLLHDAEKMEVKELAKRYQKSASQIWIILRKNGIKPKTPVSCVSKQRDHHKQRLSSVPDLTESAFTTVNSKNHNPHISYV